MQQVLTSGNVTRGFVPGAFSHAAEAQTNIFTEFLEWCNSQEKNRMLWLALTFLGQIGVALPCTLFAILVFAGNNFNLWILTCIINVPVLAINLAAQPTRITVPALFFAWSADILIIISCFAVYLAINS